MTSGFSVFFLTSACECTTISKQLREMKGLPYSSAEEAGNPSNLPLPLMALTPQLHEPGMWEHSWTREGMGMSHRITIWKQDRVL